VGKARSLITYIYSCMFVQGFGSICWEKRIFAKASKLSPRPKTGKHELANEGPSPSRQAPSDRGDQGKGGNVAYKEYKVIHVVEGGLGTILLGASGIPMKKMETLLNQEAADGWQLVFQAIEQKRFFLFWKREAVIITLGR